MSLPTTRLGSLLLAARQVCRSNERPKQALVVALCLATTGCSGLPGMIDRGVGELKLLLGLKKPEPVSPSRNSELLNEMLTVVLRTPPDSTEFADWLNTLDQGASLEGVYNALTHSSRYRGLEETDLTSSPETVQLFVREILEIQKGLPSPTPLTRTLAQALQAPVDPALPPSAELTRQISYGQRPSTSRDPAELQKLFASASPFTLKRVLGDEALRRIATLSPTRDRLSVWYADWATRLATSGVDFGLQLRNREDRAFHLKWAIAAHREALTWEVLNRLHRLLNASLDAAMRTQASPPAPPAAGALAQ